LATFIFPSWPNRHPGESDIYEKIVRALASKRRGLTRTELLAALKTGSGGSLNRRLKELEEAGFIAHMTPYDKARKDTTYRIIDPYVYFFLSWIERAPSGVFANSGEKYWLEKSRSPAYLAWAGYSFENLCLTHLPWIQRALRLDHVGYEAGSWNHVPLRGSATNLGAQIDLLFDRSDGVVSLCEIKFNTDAYTVTKTYARDLQRKLDIFQTITRTMGEGPCRHWRAFPPNSSFWISAFRAWTGIWWRRRFGSAIGSHRCVCTR
jgi:uncharacterized protein